MCIKSGGTDTLVSSPTMTATSDIAVNYTPDQASAQRYTTVSDLRLEEQGIKYVRVQYVDYGNVVRFRVLPVAYFKRICKNPRPGLNFTSLALAFVGIQFAGGFDSERAGECLHAIDLNSFRVCTYAPGHAVVMTWFQEKTPVPDAGLTIPLCPRTLLQRVVGEAREKAGLDFLIGFESEFFLLKKTSPLEVVNDAGWGMAGGHLTGAPESAVVDEIIDCLEGAGIEVHFIHGEAAPGQVGRAVDQETSQTYLPSFVVRARYRADVTSRCCGCSGLLKRDYLQRRA